MDEDAITQEDIDLAEASLTDANQMVVWAMEKLQKEIAFAVKMKAERDSLKERFINPNTF